MLCAVAWHSDFTTPTQSMNLQGGLGMRWACGAPVLAGTSLAAAPAVRGVADLSARQDTIRGIPARIGGG